MISPRIVSLALLVLLLSGEMSKSFAEKFKVFYAFEDIKDVSKLEERKDLDIDLSSAAGEKQEVILIAQRVIKEELEKESSHGYSKINFALKYIYKERGIWYVAYEWRYLSEIIDRRSMPARIFREKIDLNKRVIIHDRTKDIQYTVSGSSI